MVTNGSRDRQIDPPKFQAQFQNDRDDSSSEKGSSNGDFGFEWDTSDFSRNISNAHLDQSEDAPIPIISPLETAQAPLELLVDTGKPKVDHIEYLTRCETPPPTQIEDFNKSFVSESIFFCPPTQILFSEQSYKYRRKGNGKCFETADAPFHFRWFISR